MNFPQFQKNRRIIGCRDLRSDIKKETGISYRDLPGGSFQILAIAIFRIDKKIAWVWIFSAGGIMEMSIVFHDFVH